MDSLSQGLRLDQVVRYLENRTKEFELLRPAIAVRDGEAIRLIAHRIKGNAALYGMPELGLAAGVLLSAVEVEDWSEIAERVDALIGHLETERLRFT